MTPWCLGVTICDKHAVELYAVLSPLRYRPILRDAINFNSCKSFLFLDFSQNRKRLQKMLVLRTHLEAKICIVFSLSNTYIFLYFKVIYVIYFKTMIGEKKLYSGEEG